LEKKVICCEQTTSYLIEFIGQILFLTVRVLDSSTLYHFQLKHSVQNDEGDIQNLYSHRDGCR
jgi:hypothetical protein